jgi:excisionase family DNA binding protein
MNRIKNGAVYHESTPAPRPKQSVVLHPEEYPLTVREAAKYLGVSPQSVYLWVERKQIPHLRVMGRNIGFLKSDLETFRASFKQEMKNA